ncbi:MAG: hypothetical protein R3A51_23070 [Nannocystaceae bacterium]
MRPTARSSSERRTTRSRAARARSQNASTAASSASEAPRLVDERRHRVDGSRQRRGARVRVGVGLERTRGPTKRGLVRRCDRREGGAQAVVELRRPGLPREHERGVRRAQGVEHVGGARVHLGGEVPALPWVVQERPDIVDASIRGALEEAIGRQPVAELVAAAIERAPIHQRQRARHLLERDPQVDEVQRRAAVLMARGVVVKQQRRGPPEDLLDRGAGDILIGVHGHRRVVIAQTPRTRAPTHRATVRPRAAHQQALGRDVQDAQPSTVCEAQRGALEVATQRGDVGLLEAAGDADALERALERDVVGEVGAREAVDAQARAEVCERGAVVNAAATAIERLHAEQRVLGEGPRAEPVGRRWIGGDVLGPREAEHRVDRGGPGRSIARLGPRGHDGIEADRAAAVERAAASPSLVRTTVAPAIGFAARTREIAAARAGQRPKPARIQSLIAGAVSSTRHASRVCWRAAASSSGSVVPSPIIAA